MDLAVHLSMNKREFDQENDLLLPVEPLRRNSQLTRSISALEGSSKADRRSGIPARSTSERKAFANWLSFIYNLSESNGGTKVHWRIKNVVEQTGIEMSDLVAMTADVVAAYVAQNALPSAELPALIQQIHATLRQVASGAQQPAEQPLTPAVPIKKSVTRDYIICLEDGKRFKSLKRHLRSSFNLSPEEYRKKWGLPYDYPMVAPNYAQTRSELAKSMGLGNMRQKAKQATASSARAARKSPAKRAKAVATPKKTVRKPK